MPSAAPYKQSKLNGTEKGNGNKQGGHLSGGGLEVTENSSNCRIAEVRNGNGELLQSANVLFNLYYGRPYVIKYEPLYDLGTPELLDRSRFLCRGRNQRRNRILHPLCVCGGERVPDQGRAVDVASNIEVTPRDVGHARALPEEELVLGLRAKPHREWAQFI